ncbi:MAG TPA: NAD(P)/FAD-dependent oxidoreductase [Candidatus Limnocylindrales bacterium]|nr:NAD(P)/FAD-dependent oxidoreductase [Candidatus Limnocylindrales bacterium]
MTSSTAAAAASRAVRPEPASVDAVVVGSGPNGLAAAITIARTGRSVAVYERNETPGGGARSAEITLPRYVHDICSAIHPFGRTSPFFAELGFDETRLPWIRPPAAVAHPLDDGTAVFVRGDVEETARALERSGSAVDRDDAGAYRRLMNPIVGGWDTIAPDILAPFHIPISPLRTLRLARFGLSAIQSATSIARRFRGERARALFAGAAAHSIIGLTEPISGAAGLVMLASAHADGWPFPEGGAGRIAGALVTELERLGGRVITSHAIEAMDELPAHDVALFDVAPRNLAAIAGDRLPDRFRERLFGYRHGAGVFKLDLAIEGPLPWRAADVADAGTVHLGGTLEEIARSEFEVAAGRSPKRPFVLLAQPSLFDRTRAPEGHNTVWAYCHVPNGSTDDMSEPILDQIERFAPGARARVLAMRASSPAEIEAMNPNDVGGDIGGGRFDLGQLFTRPSWRVFDPYSTPDPRIFICSAATPPGGGVHGMCGYHAARSALRRLA